MTTAQTLQPFRLQVKFVERVWGKLDLKPWYDKSFQSPVGEAWLTGGDCLVETGEHAGKTLAEVEQAFPEALCGSNSADAGEAFPLLVKMLFPQEKLSVQVHPDDADAAALGGNARAKTECWYVLEASPEATVSLGLVSGTTDSEVRSALGHASFEQLLHQEPVSTGDMVYVEAGTVHAIGPGMVLLEVQQTSDTTYRLFDYGRPRELHLQDGMKVVKLQTGSGKRQPQPLSNGARLIEEQHFAVDRFDLPVGGRYETELSGQPECVIGLSGTGALLTEASRVDLVGGQAIVVPAACSSFRVKGECSFVRCAVPRTRLEENLCRHVAFDALRAVNPQRLCKTHRTQQ